MDNPKIMIVDDEETLATFLAKVLKEDNPDFEIDVKTSGEEALEILPEFAPDLVLLDIRLPKKDGTEVLKEIKEFDRDIQVVMMTGFASLDTAVASLREGAYDYVNKPFETSQVKAIVKNAIERRMLLKEREILINDLSEANEKLSEANAMLKEKKDLADKALEHKVEQLSKLNKISHNMNSKIEIERLLKVIPEATLDLLDAEGSTVLFLDESKTHLITKGVAGDLPLKLGSTISSDLSPFDVSITKKSVDQTKSVKIGKKEFGPVVCSSLSASNQNIGALCVLHSELMDNDSLQLLNTIAASASTALENASLFDDLQRSSLEVILSLMLIKGFTDQSLKDSSERISELTEGVARDLGLDKEYIRHLKYAALIHDIGRVVLGNDVTDYKLIFEKTKNIVGHVRFLRKAIEIINGALMDFSKEADKIPLASRIFAVVFEFEEQARSGKELSDVMDFLEAEQGERFDKDVVKSFKKLLESKAEE
jgi:response regulator RpfG family c-di-GMP phosphodiesterase